MSKYKKWVLLLILLILVSGMVYYAVRGWSSKQISINGLLDRNFDVVALAADGAGMDLDSDIKIISKTATKLSDIKTSLLITPEQSYDVKEVSDKEFLIHFNEELSPNSLYQVALSNDGDKELSWAFQTKKEFKIIRTLPRDKGTYVPVDSGIEIQFSYPNIESIDNYFEITPKIEGRFEYHKDTVVYVHKGLKENTVYTVKLKPGIGLKNSSEKTNDEYVFQFKTENDENRSSNYFRFSDEMNNITSESTPYLEINAGESFKNRELKVEVYKYKQMDDFINNIKKIDSSKFDWREENEMKLDLDSSIFDKVLEFETTLLSADSAYWDRTYLGLPEHLNEGYYLINVIHNDKNYQTHLQVNDLIIYTMVGEKESLTWVNDSITGKPVEAAKVSVVGGNKSALSDEQGIAVIDGNVSIKEPFTRAYFEIKSDNRPSFFVRVKPDYYEYQDFYFDDYYGEFESTSYWTYLYMDRGIYLPTDKVNVWGLVKSRENLDVAQKAVLYLNSSNYGEAELEVDRKEITFNQFGSFDESFEFANLIHGRYSVELKINDELVSKKYFDIAEYTKPAYRIETEFENENIFVWESSKLKINANFFEGTPVSGLKLDYNYYEDSYGEEKERSGVLVCDKNGYDEYKYVSELGTYDWRPRNTYINIRNAEAEDEEVWVEEYIRVFPKDIMINIESKVSEDKKTANIELKTNKIDIDKEEDGERIWKYEDAYKGETLDTNLEVLIYEKYYEKKEIGEYYDFINKKVMKKYDYQEHSKLLKEIDAQTINGVYSFDFPLEEEKNYYIDVRGRDTRGNAIVESSYLNIFNYYDWYYGDKYNIIEEDDDKQNYRIEDEISLKLHNKGENVKETDGDSMLYLVLQDGLKSYTIKDSVKNDFEFDKELIPNYYIRAIYFDGENIFKAGLKPIHYDYTEKGLNIDVKTNKNDYKPGDTVVLDISSKDLNGSPVKADINISVVDEAFFAVREQHVDTLQSIYNYCYGTGMLLDYVSYTEVSFDSRGMAEGGEGDNQALRVDFKDTAIFKSTTIDDNGKASICFVLPDNLTSWRITYQGITENLRAGDGKININSKLPFFVSAIMTDRYLVGDSPYISLRSFGTELATNDEVDYTVTLKHEDGDTQSFKAGAKGNEYANVELKDLEEGKYTITIEARSNDHYDGIRKEFEVVDSTLELIKTDYEDLNKDTKIKSGKGFTKIHLYNKSSSLYYNALMSLKNSWGDRVDQQLSRIVATDMLNKNYDTDEKLIEYDMSKYQLNDGGIALLPYSDSEPALSAKTASLAPELFDKNALKGYFYGVINNEESIKKDVLFSYWGLAALGEPVLVDIQRLFSEEDLTIKDELILSIALAELGDTVRAEDKYIELIKAHGKTSGTSTYINAEGNKDDILEATSLASVLSTKLKLSERYSLFSYVVQNHTKDILTNLEQLICIKNDVPHKEQKVEFSYVLNGTVKKVTLINNEIYEILLDSEEANNIEFKDIKGEIELITSTLSPVKDVIKTKDDNVSLTRSYTYMGSTVDSFNHSDIVKVVITPNFKETSPDGYYEVMDILPSGLRYIKSYTKDKTICYPNDRNGQKISFGYYYSKENPRKSIVYYARAVTSGEYTSDYAVIKHYLSDTLGIAEQQKIIINE